MQASGGLRAQSWGTARLGELRPVAAEPAGSRGCSWLPSAVLAPAAPPSEERSPRPAALARRRFSGAGNHSAASPGQGGSSPSSPSLPSPGDANPGQGSGEGKLSSSPAAARTTSSARLSRPSLLRSKAGREKPFSGKGTRS